MSKELLDTSESYQKILKYAASIKQRCDKAKSLHLDNTSEFYRAYREIVYRNEVMTETVQFIRNMSSAVSYPKCVEDASCFVVNRIDRYPECDGEEYSEYLGAALKLPDCKHKMQIFCDSMDVFTNYKPETEEILFNQTVDMIACGVDLLMSIREHICSVNRK